MKMDIEGEEFLYRNENILYPVIRGLNFLNCTFQKLSDIKFYIEMVLVKVYYEIYKC